MDFYRLFGARVSIFKLVIVKNINNFVHLTIICYCNMRNVHIYPQTQTQARSVSVCVCVNTVRIFYCLSESDITFFEYLMMRNLLLYLILTLPELKTSFFRLIFFGSYLDTYTRNCSALPDNENKIFNLFVMP